MKQAVDVKGSEVRSIVGPDVLCSKIRRIVDRRLASVASLPSIIQIMEPRGRLSTVNMFAQGPAGRQVIFKPGPQLDILR